MNKQGKRKLRLRVENVENRCLLSTAVVDIQNQSNLYHYLRLSLGSFVGLVCLHRDAWPESS